VHERAVRAAIAARVLSDDPHPAETLIVHELALCQAEARVDVATINGQFVGWEIKTRTDRLSRLPKQQSVYSRVFDRVWLVADDRHIGPATAMIPPWWGVLRIGLAGHSCALELIRPSMVNPGVDLHALVRLLWRDEALQELHRLGLDGGVERAPRRILWDRLANAAPATISESELRSRVRSRLREREDWRADPLQTSGDD
jgi:hypothetical protein